MAPRRSDLHRHKPTAAEHSGPGIWRRSPGTKNFEHKKGWCRCEAWLLRISHLDRLHLRKKCQAQQLSRKEGLLCEQHPSLICAHQSTSPIYNQKQSTCHKHLSLANIHTAWHEPSQWLQWTKSKWANLVWEAKCKGRWIPSGLTECSSPQHSCQML